MFDVLPFEDASVALLDFFSDFTEEFLCGMWLSCGGVCAPFEGSKNFVVCPWGSAVNRASVGGIVQQ